MTGQQIFNVQILLGDNLVSHFLKLLESLLGAHALSLPLAQLVDRVFDQLPARLDQKKKKKPQKNRQTF
jgi:hypothetical protein